jgi:4-hydroxy-3-methylbut-2-enyl diphosphate reductase
MKVYLANPRGFCAGVIRAIATVKNMLAEHGAPVYVLHEIVHNRHVIQELEELGAVFVAELEEIPQGAICIFSAHGVSRAVEERARHLGLRPVNATCPLVSSVHTMVEKRHHEGCTVMIIGHHGHPEVEGTAGRVDGRVFVVASVDEVQALPVADGEKVAYVTQTTLSQDEVAEIRAALAKRFPDIKGPGSNICYATQNRQNAVRELAGLSDLLLVVGSKNSSNSNRLREVAQQEGTRAFLIDDAGEIEPDWLANVQRVGITAGASAPERLVEEVVDSFSATGAVGVVELEGTEQKVRFPLATLEED